MTPNHGSAYSDQGKHGDLQLTSDITHDFQRKAK